MTKPLFEPGPPPPGGVVQDGLRDAFRRAHRRRLRKAAASGLPVLLGVAALSTLPAGGGLTSLDTTPAGPPTVRATGADGSAAVAADRPADIGAGGGAGGAGGTGGAGAATGAGRTGPARPGSGPGDAPATPLPPLPTGLPPGGRPTPEYLEFSTANGTASTHVVLPETVHVGHAVRITTSGRYAGLYVVSDDGATAGGVFRLPLAQPGIAPVEHHSTPVAPIGDWKALPAGGYTVYVVGEGQVTVRVQLRDGETGIEARATAPATAHFDETAKPFATGATSAAVRLPVSGDRTAVGLGAGYITSSGGKTSSSFTACLASRGDPCAPGDPHSGGGADVSVGGTEGGGVEIAEGALATGRDLLGEGEVAAATDARIYLSYVVLDLP